MPNNKKIDQLYLQTFQKIATSKDFLKEDISVEIFIYREAPPDDNSFYERFEPFADLLIAD